MNKKALMIAGVTENDFKKWCKDNNKASYKTEVKVDFFARIQDGRLVKDANGNLVKKKKRS